MNINNTTAAQIIFEKSIQMNESAIAGEALAAAIDLSGHRFDDFSDDRFIEIVTGSIVSASITFGDHIDAALSALSRELSRIDVAGAIADGLPID